MIGVGRDADPETGTERGLQFSLFDVSDELNPRQACLSDSQCAFRRSNHDLRAASLADRGSTVPRLWRTPKAFQLLVRELDMRAAGVASPGIFAMPAQLASLSLPTGSGAPPITSVWATERTTSKGFPHMLDVALNPLGNVTHLDSDFWDEEDDDNNNYWWAYAQRSSTASGGHVTRSLRRGDAVYTFSDNFVAKNGPRRAVDWYRLARRQRDVLRVRRRRDGRLVPVCGKCFLNSGRERRARGGRLARLRLRDVPLRARTADRARRDARPPKSWASRRAAASNAHFACSCAWSRHASARRRCWTTPVFAPYRHCFCFRTRSRSSSMSAAGALLPGNAAAMRCTLSKASRSAWAAATQGAPSSSPRLAADRLCAALSRGTWPVPPRPAWSALRP